MFRSFTKIGALVALSLTAAQPAFCQKLLASFIHPAIIAQGGVTGLLAMELQENALASKKSNTRGHEEVQVQWDPHYTTLTSFYVKDVEYYPDHSVHNATVSRDFEFSNAVGKIRILNGTRVQITKNHYSFRNDYENQINVDLTVEGQRYQTQAYNLDLSAKNADIVGISNIYEAAFGPTVYKAVDGKLIPFSVKAVYANGALHYGTVNNKANLAKFTMQNQSIAAHQVGFYPNGKISFLYLDQPVTLETANGYFVYCQPYYVVSFDQKGWAIDSSVENPGNGCRRI